MVKISVKRYDNMEYKLLDGKDLAGRMKQAMKLEFRV